MACIVYLIVRVIKSRRLRWTGHIARMGKYRSAFKIVIQERDLQEGLSIDGMTVLEWILNIYQYEKLG
jgi:hypothetical protein